MLRSFRIVALTRNHCSALATHKSLFIPWGPRMLLQPQQSLVGTGVSHR